MRLVAFALACLMLSSSLAEAKRVCLFFCWPAGHRHHHQRHRAQPDEPRPVYVQPLDCRGVNEAVAGLTAAHVESMRPSMTKRQLEVLDRCTAGRP
jgi:hypothetical protein